MGELEPAEPFNLDVVLRALRWTVLSPSFAMMTVAIAYMFQKVPSTGNDMRNAVIYFGVCCSIWFLQWSSRVWASRSWEYGLSGLLATNRIQWSSQVAVVTGGGQGLGKAFTSVLRTKGVPVAVLDRNVPPKSEWEDGVHYYQCDVSDFNQVSEAAQKIEREVGTPTILINNAGVVSGRPLLELTEAEIRRTFDVNTLASFWTLKSFLPGLLAKGTGHVVNISSILGTMGVAGCTDYCASKFAVVGMHDALKAEVTKQHPEARIHFTLVLPSHIRTSLFAGLKPFSPLNKFLLPMLEPHEVALRVINQIELQQTGELNLPALVNITWIWRGIPSFGRDFLNWLSEANDSMSQFHSKKPAKEASKA